MRPLISFSKVKTEGTLARRKWCLITGPEADVSSAEIRRGEKKKKKWHHTGQKPAGAVIRLGRVGGAANAKHRV